MNKKIKFRKSVEISPKAHQEDNSDVAFIQPGLILSPSLKLKALPALESVSSLSSSSPLLSMGNSDSKSSKVSLNSVIKQAAREANKLEPFQKLLIGASLRHGLKEVKKLKSSKVPKRNYPLFKPLRKQFSRKKTFNNSWTKITNPDLLEGRPKQVSHIILFFKSHQSLKWKFSIFKHIMFVLCEVLIFHKI